MKEPKLLVAIVGPTAVGKTSVTIGLAKTYNAQILSADSRQFYREMEIGTAKPTLEELSQVKHHFINTQSVEEEYNVGRYEKEALELLEELFQKQDVVFMAGGSGLFVAAVCNGLDQFPEIPSGIREALIEEQEAGKMPLLLEELKDSDPIYYEEVDRQNPQRILRALEVIRGTGKPFSAFRKSQAEERPFHILKIGLEMDREKIYQRIDDRMDLMIKAGLFEEAEQLKPYQSLNALQTVGYREIFAFLDGEYDKQEAIRLLKRNSRRYAKRQLTWFKKDEATQWFHPSQTDKIEGLINTTLESLKAKD